MGEADAGAAAGRVLAALREARRSEVTIGNYEVVLGRFAAFLAGLGLDSASDQVCVDFASPARPGPGWGQLRTSGCRTSASRRSAGAAVLMAIAALAGRELVVALSR